MATKHNFGPASREERVVYGACRPGYGDNQSSTQAVADWIAFMTEQGIERVCCLLDEEHLRRYDDLLASYDDAFGTDQVLPVPIKDFEQVGSSQFHNRIRPFFGAAENEDEPVVVHCSAGQGRTGHVLALWLATDRGYTLENALEEVQQVEDTVRRPLEGASLTGLRAILEATPGD